jgi:hypothetical protein
MSELSNLIKDVVASPLGDVIAAVGRGVADAQQALDEGSLAKTLEIYSEGGAEVLQMLRDIGYAPTFYSLPETTGEVRIAMRLGNNQSSAVNLPSANPVAATPAINANLARLGLNVPALKTKLYATPVDAGYANRYGYQADISAKLTFKIVPVPAPTGVDELRVLPDLVGATAVAALQRLSALGLTANFVNAQGETVAEPGATQTVASQTPAYDPARSPIVRVGDEIELVLK